ncbi:RCC1 domain-containing protein [Corallococcus coralloides]|uniref:RCC1 domain-containing protein n=1 Tax=Corallococcus coralloides TaxID=184914 RepID=UPI00384EC9A2
MVEAELEWLSKIGHLRFEPEAITSGGNWVTGPLKAAGTIWAWGQNNYGQLGDGTTMDRATPAQVPGLTNVASLAAGNEHSLTVKQDGSVWGWGFNGYGLIDDSNTDVFEPKQIAAPGAWSLTVH